MAVGFIALAGGGGRNRRGDADLSRPALAEIRTQRQVEGTGLNRSDLRQAIMTGAVERVRPKMMTVVAIMAGLLPILWSTGTGSEVMRRIAVPMVGQTGQWRFRQAVERPLALE